MTWIVRPLERRDAEGKPSGLWHLTAESDAGGVFTVGCDHDHPSAQEAQDCEDARVRIGEATGFPVRRKGAKIELNRIDSHPLSRRFYALSRELDGLPPDPRQTALMIALADLQRQTQTLLDDEDYRSGI